jgi:transcriptional regulator with XRE-family HTH domain
MIEMATIVAEHKGAAALIMPLCVVELYFGIEFAQLSIIQWRIQRETSVMNADQTVQLINVLSKKRAESGLSVAEVARRANVDVAAVWRIEQGMIASPKAESLLAIGDVLGIPAVDLFTIVGWLPGDELPTLGPYLRAKYGQLPADAVERVEKYVTAVADAHDTDVEDEDRRTVRHKES